MGVPKFYRWISERYPCLSQVIREHQIPEFDNMYLDMNGIIHPCSHPNDDDAHFRITEAEIFQNIFNYIEVLFRLIKPQKVFFMAVDGVAPRAKMNQQRSRRFRTAMESEKQRKEAIAKGETLPEGDRFDSNCITPGTVFMYRLHEQLKYFVNMKISKDPAWQKVQVILSGHDVPGEGEHKIMDYIRWTKQQDNYNPNTRHCLYGLDADLMFLGLATHELHFSLLREEVKFGKAAQKKISNAEEQKFHLLHLSLFREYLDHEFQCLKKDLGNTYNLEHIIDDFILLGFLVGNDFIPHLPDFHIHANTLPLLWSTYKKVRPTIDGYLHDNGVLNLERFGTYLDVLSRVDLERFEVQYADMKWLAGKSEEAAMSRREKKDEMVELQKKFGGMMLMDSDDEFDDDGDDKFTGTVEEDDEIEEASMLLNEFRATKNLYYINKFHLKQEEVEGFIKTISFKYIEGITWILEYYFRGVPSWSWYYPYHYAPYLSDVIDVSKMEIKLNLNSPFKPFQQLMAVLPAGSSKLLPKPLQELYKAASPVKDFYPEEFDTDLNGKKQEWEAVVLIPFIDEERLLEAMLEPLQRLTAEEAKRNSHGKCIISRFDVNVTDTYISQLPKTFPDVRASYTRMEYEEADCFRTPPEKLVCKTPDPDTDPFTMGFPTTRHLKHTSTFEGAGCKVFQHASRDQNCILNIDPQADTTIEDYAKFLGTSVHVDFPHLVEALVVGVYNESTEYVFEENCVVKRPADKNKKDSFKHVKSRECISLKSRFGIEVGDVACMIRVKKVRGRLPHVESTGSVKFVTHWYPDDTWVPGQLVLPNLPMPVPLQKKIRNLNIEDIFPTGKNVFLINNPGYGSIGKVTGIVDNKVRISVTLSEEPYFDELRNTVTEDSNNWYSAKEASYKLGISSFLLSKITSTFQVEVPNKNGKGASKINIGLSIKYANKNLMAPEYARKMCNGGWQFSESLVKIMSQYKNSFPELFVELQNHIQKDIVKVDEICEKFGPDFDYREYIDKVRKFLKSLPLKNIQLVGVGSELLSTTHIDTLVTQLLTHQKHLDTKSELDLKVKPKVLFNPSFQNGVLPPDAKTEFELCDRVVNVCPCHSVPFGAKGTLIGIQKSQDQKTDNAKYDVLFDQPIIGGRSIGKHENRLYTMMPFFLINISYGVRSSELDYKLKQAKSPRYNTQDHYRQPHHRNVLKNPARTHHANNKHEGGRIDYDRKHRDANRTPSRYKRRSDEGSVESEDRYRKREDFRRYPSQGAGLPVRLPQAAGRTYGPPIVPNFSGYQPYNYNMMYYGRPPGPAIPSMYPPSYYTGFDPYTGAPYASPQPSMGVLSPTMEPKTPQRLPQTPGAVPHVVSPLPTPPEHPTDLPVQYDSNGNSKDRRQQQKRGSKSGSSEGGVGVSTPVGVYPAHFSPGAAGPAPPHPHPATPPRLPFMDPYLMYSQMPYIPVQYPDGSVTPQIQAGGGMTVQPTACLVSQTPIVPPAPVVGPGGGVMPQQGYTQVMAPDGTIMTVPTNVPNIGYYSTYY